MKIRGFAIVAVLLLGVGLLASVRNVLGSSPVPEPLQVCPLSKRAADLYVAPSGADVGNCTDDVSPCRTVQYAVDRAGEDSVVKVAAGVYTGVHGRPRNDVIATGTVTQVVYVSKTVTIRGGYTTANWATSDPEANPTMLDAQGEGRVFYITGAITPTIEGLRITGGDGTWLGGSPDGFGAGGGVYVITATGILQDNQVFSNTSGAGGGVYMYASKSVLHGNSITINVADDGGGLYLQESEPVLSGNTIVANTAHWAGGGLCLKDSAGVLSQTTVASNTGYLGGGLYLRGSGAILDGDLIAFNTGGAGGALYLEESAVALRRSRVLDNEALRGGGLFLGLSRATLTNDVVADNQAENEGDGLYLIGSSVRVLHTTIARNGLAGLSGNDDDSSGIYAITSFSADSTTIVLTNTILVSHTLGITVGTGSSVTVEGMVWGAGVWANATDWGGSGTVVVGTANVWGDPAFVDPDNGDYHIRPSSAAVDAGVDAGSTPLCSHDIDGDLRTDGRPDIGADELVALLAVTKRADPDPVEPGARLMYTVRVTNTGDLDLNATITDTLPTSVTLDETTGHTLLLPGGTVGITWTASLSAPGGIWTGTVAVIAAEDYEGPLTNQVEVTTEEGARGDYTEVSTVASERLMYLPLIMRDHRCETLKASMTISATATTVGLGEPVTVTAMLFNQGCVALGMPQYSLTIGSDEPQPIFDPGNPEPVVHYLAVGPGQSDAEAFVLRAVRSGQATLRASTSFEVHTSYGAYWGGSSAEPLTITVTAD